VLRPIRDASVSGRLAGDEPGKVEAGEGAAALRAAFVEEDGGCPSSMKARMSPEISSTVKPPPMKPMAMGMGPCGKVVVPFPDQSGGGLVFSENQHI
jgi:hypothetical protein